MERTEMDWTEMKWHRAYVRVVLLF